LKSHLDDALGAEELVVQLTERNLALADVSPKYLLTLASLTDAFQKNEDLRLTIEELEQLKELGDELEEHHVETERTLEEEIGE
jgi:dynactin 1